ncbi:MAG: NAD(P)-binding domain-containing protein, partial [Pseudomonadota bacterium]
MNTDGTIPHGAVIIGAGQAGLAMSRALSARGVDHLLLERGAVGHAWRTARWDSLTMLTPNWANALPGAPYDGNAPDGFMTASAFSWRLDRYAHAIGAPVQDRTEVCAVRRDDAGYRIETTSGPVLGRSLVIASGACAQAAVPAISKAVPPGVLSTTPARYRRPSDLPPGGVLVVGASASGVQIARELQRSGRHVTISVGNHIRLPRHYRGRDIEGWLDAIGLLDERAEQIEDLARARQMPSPQLQGGPDAVDLNALQAIGVEVVGRLTDIRDGRALFSGGLHHLVAGADLKMARLLDQIDHWVHDHGHESALPPPDRPPPTRLPAAPALSLPLGGGVS